MLGKLVSGVKALMHSPADSRRRKAPDSLKDQVSDLDVSSPHDAFDILRHNVRVVRKERLSRRVPPHQRRGASSHSVF